MRTIRRGASALSMALCACAPLRAQPAAPSASTVLATLDARAPGWLAEHGVPSMAVAYIRDGRVQWTRTYGQQAEGVPATDATLYNVASLTKPLFAELVLRLAADGRLSLDEPMAPVWVDPDLANDPRHALLTPRWALSHQMGFTNWRYQTGDTLRFTKEPGTEFGYSGEGYEYARRFVERKLGASTDSLARQYLFRPLGLTDISFTRQPWFEGRMALPKGPEGRWGQPSVGGEANAADNIHTTIADYAAWVASVVRREGLPAEYVAQRDSSYTPGGERCDPAKVPLCPVRVGYGLGWTIFEYADPAQNVHWHTGGDWGEKSIVFYWPHRGEGVVVFANGANGFHAMSPALLLLSEGTDFNSFLRTGG